MNIDLYNLLGNAAFQDAETIRISKQSIGLSPGIQDAESILLALIVRALQPFEGVVTGNGAVVTGNGIRLTYRNHSVSEEITLFFWQKSFRVNKVGKAVEVYSYVLEVRSPYSVDETII
jgi:hypothetical protein